MFLSVCLQCGRIHKDAEIGIVTQFEVDYMTCLQCGRIHKDAEIRLSDVYTATVHVSLQCGRIHKDAEMRSLDDSGSAQRRVPSMWPHP